MSISRRKNQHLKLTNSSQTGRNFVDSRFNYEPLLSPHPVMSQNNFKFLGESIGGPIFLSSITGGSKRGNKLNRVIATTAKELSLPMGLGSIRAFIDGSVRDSFKIRSITGPDIQLFGNIGIAQLENMLNNNTIKTLLETILQLELSGLIIHINPLQEWVQPEGDRYRDSPLNTLIKALPYIKCKTIVKEVGCGFGPKSLKELMRLPIDVIDFASFGGTNFTKMELLRTKLPLVRESKSPLINIGHTPDDMIRHCNSLIKQGFGSDKEFIISGGIKNFLDGYYYNSILNAPSIYGYAKNIVKHGLISTNQLINYLSMEIESYSFANNFLTIRE